jgi:hypothetical protein
MEHMNYLYRVLPKQPFTMQENIFDNEIITPQRPVFLKVLCMLTFIGSGYNIINSAVTYFKADAISKIFVDVRSEMDKDLSEKKNAKDTGEVKLVTNIMNTASEISTPENLRKTAIANFATSIICLTGAILMWKLRRTGYYLYVLGTIIGIIIPFYLFGANFLTNISAGVMGFIGILFVIFYAMNLKSMK